MVMQTLTKRHNVKTLSEKILLLLNRGGKTHKHTYTPSIILYNASWHTSIFVLCYVVSPVEDPVCVFKHAPPAPHSVLKFLHDVFASRETANIFYRTDMMVMIDIAVRQISDLSPGDKV